MRKIKEQKPQTGLVALQAEFRVISRWDRGFQGEFAVLNRGHDPVEHWSLRFRPAWELLEVLNGTHRVEADGASMIMAGETAQVLPPGTTACISFIAGGEPGCPGNLRCQGRRTMPNPLSRREPVFRHQGAALLRQAVVPFRPQARLFRS